LCREQGPVIDGRIRIPWPQVGKVTIVTASVLALHCVVGKYTGGEEGAESYTDVDIVVYVVGCPAGDLKNLVTQRSQLCMMREDMKLVLSAGTIQMAGDDGSGDLSLGSSTVRDLDESLTYLKAQLKNLDSEDDDKRLVRYLEYRSKVNKASKQVPLVSGSDRSRNISTARPPSDRFNPGIRYPSIVENERYPSIVDEKSASIDIAGLGATTSMGARVASMRIDATIDEIEAAGVGGMAINELVSAKHVTPRDKLSGAINSTMAKVRQMKNAGVSKIKESAKDQQRRLIRLLVPTHHQGSSRESDRIRSSLRETLKKHNATSKGFDSFSSIATKGDQRLGIFQGLNFKGLQSVFPMVEEKRICIPNDNEMRMLFRGKGWAERDYFRTGYTIKRREYLVHGVSRLEIYKAILIGFGLTGHHDYTEESIRALCKRDIAATMTIGDDGKESDVDISSARIEHLVMLAEIRIRDTILCGWHMRGGMLENSLKLMVNRYYATIISLLGQFFNMSSFKAVRGLESKIKLIDFFVSNDDRFAISINSALRSFKLCIQPQPTLSLCLDFSKFISWYGSIVRTEMTEYINATVIQWKDDAKARIGKDPLWLVEEPLPWLPVRKGEGSIFISLIPEDCITVLSQYVMHARPHRDDSDVTHNELLDNLDLAIAEGLIHSFNHLATLQRETIENICWVTALSKQSQDGKVTSNKKGSGFMSSFAIKIGVFSSNNAPTSGGSKSTRREREFAADEEPAEDAEAIDYHVPFLASVCNDCIRLISNRSIEHFVIRVLAKKDDDLKMNTTDVDVEAKLFSMEAQKHASRKDGGMKILEQEVEHRARPAYHSIQIVTSLALHGLSCIVFSSDEVRKIISGKHIVMTAAVTTEKKSWGFGKKKGSMTNSYKDLRSVWKAAVYAKLESPFVSLMKVLEGELAYAKDFLEEYCYSKLLVVCAEKLCLLYYHVLVEAHNDKNDTFDVEYALAFKEDVVQLSKFLNEKMSVLPDGLRRVTEHNLHVTLENLHASANVLCADSKETIMLAIQEFIRQSQNLSVVNSAANCRSLATMVNLRIRQGQKKDDNSSDVNAGRGGGAMDWRDLALMIMTGSLENMLLDAHERESRGEEVIDPNPTGVVPKYNIPLLRLAFGPLSDIEDFEESELHSPTSADSPSADMTSIEILRGSTASWLKSLKSFTDLKLAKEVAKAAAIAKRASTLKSESSTSTITTTTTTPTTGVGNQSSVESPTRSPQASISSDDKKGPVSPVLTRPMSVTPKVITLRHLSIAHIMATSSYASAPKVFIKMALVPSINRNLDIKEIEWQVESVPTECLFLMTAIPDNDFKLKLPPNFSSLDILFGIFYAPRMYGDPLHIGIARVSLAMMMISSLDDREVPIKFDTENPKILQAAQRVDSHTPGYTASANILVTANVEAKSSRYDGNDD
jgi:hypothetical protein